MCARVIRPVALPNKSEGARDAGGRTDPRASASRDTEAERRSRPGPPSVLSKPQVRLLSSVPRAVFEACSARPPVDFVFRPLRALRYFGAYPPFLGLGSAWPLVRRDGAATKSPLTRTCRAGTARLGPPALGVRVAPVRGHRQPVPLVDASRSALGWTGLRGM